MGHHFMILVSLTQDARIDVSEDIEKYLINFYLTQNKVDDRDFFLLLQFNKYSKTS